MNTAEQLIACGRRTIKIETEAVAALNERIDESFVAACQLILASPSRVVVTGMGKSGHIARKIAATLASTGTPAFFVHPGEAAHGDMGMITCDDVVIALSNSGESNEIASLLPLFKRLRVKLIAMTGRPGSLMAQAADVHLNTGVKREACPLDLAPTSSTTSALVMGDALATALLEVRGFTEQDFAFSHPGGKLGRRLLLRVKDIMHTGKRLPLVCEGTSLAEALLEMSRKGMGMTTVVDHQGRLAGIFTDGDLRRALDLPLSPASIAIETVMTAACVTISEELLAAEALSIMQTRKINGLVCMDGDLRPTGAINLHDLLRSGVL